MCTLNDTVFHARRIASLLGERKKYTFHATFDGKISLCGCELLGIVRGIDPAKSVSLTCVVCSDKVHRYEV